MPNISQYERSFEKWDVGEMTHFYDKWKPDPGLIEYTVNASKKGWYNYPLMYKGRCFPEAKQRFPYLCSLLEKNRHRIDIAGFSILKPGAIIKPHIDDHPANIRTYHLTIDSGQPYTKLVAGNKEFYHKPGQELMKL